MEEQTIQTYDRMAARYAAHPGAPLDREIKHFAALVGKGGLVLDAGCGPAQYARKLAAHGLSVLPFDLSPGMLAQAQAAGTPNILQADMCHLPFLSGIADGCFACASLLHLPRTSTVAALTEFRRLLSEEGILYVSLKEGMGEAWVAAAEGERFFVYYQDHQIDRLLETTGFRVIDGWISPPTPPQEHRWINRFARTR